MFYNKGYDSKLKNFKAHVKGPDGKWRNTRVYDVWYAMLKRCYKPGFNKNYEDVEVCEEWLDFQNFAEWYYLQPSSRQNSSWQIDKDILNKNSRLYSSSTCRMVPVQVNVLIREMKPRSTTQGVSFHKRDGYFRAYVKDQDGKHLEKNGFKTEQEAFLWYKSNKEEVIKLVAQKYMEVLDEDVYTALMEYKITIRGDNL